MAKSTQLFSFLTIFNVALGIVLSLFFPGNIGISSLMGHIGNLALVEAAIFFLIGGATDFIHTAKYSQANKLLKRERAVIRYEVERPQDKRTPGAGNDEWTIKESREAERRALVYISVGILLCLEIMFLALAQNMI